VVDGGEFYLEEDALIFTYETFEYFEESAPQEPLRNFKGLAAWERRSYFDGPEIGYAETVGGAEPGTDAASLIEATDRLRVALETRRGGLPRP